MLVRKFKGNEQKIDPQEKQYIARTDGTMNRNHNLNRNRNRNVNRNRNNTTTNRQEEVAGEGGHGILSSYKHRLEISNMLSEMIFYLCQAVLVSIGHIYPFYNILWWVHMIIILIFLNTLMPGLRIYWTAPQAKKTLIIIILILPDVSKVSEENVSRVSRKLRQTEVFVFVVQNP